MSFNTSGIDYQTTPTSSRSPRLNPKLWTNAAFVGASAILGTGLALFANPAQAEQLEQLAIASAQTPGIEFLDLSNAPVASSAFQSDQTPVNHDFAFAEQAIDHIQAESTSEASDSEATPVTATAGDLTSDTTEIELSQSPETPGQPVDSPPSSGDSAPQPAQPAAPVSPKPAERVLKEGSLVLGQPYIRFQGAYVLQGDESSARARLTGLYPVKPNLLFGAEVDLTTGNGFSDSPGGGLSLNELYVAYSPINMPNLRLIGGLMDLTSYFDRNSFAKDGTTHFFNRVFQTNPALSAAGIASRPGVLLNWSITDNVELKAAGFSSRRGPVGITLDSFAAELGVKFGTAIIRGTYVTSRDAGKKTGFEEIFDFRRDDGEFGLEFGDREEAYGINAEWYIPSLRVGLFGRYGHYNNQSLGRGADTYSFGLNVLDLFMPKDRFGIGYGRQLSNDGLRRDRGDKVPDVLETFYDFQIIPNLRGAVTLQFRNQFSEVIFGFRVKTEFDLVPFRRPFR